MVDSWISCKQCGHRFDASLSNCPRCNAGNSFSKSRAMGGMGRVKKITIGGIIAVVGFFAVTIGIASLASVDEPDTDQASATGNNVQQPSTQQPAASTTPSINEMVEKWEVANNAQQPVSKEVNSLKDIELSPSDISSGWEEFDAPAYRSYPQQSSTFGDGAQDYTETLEYDFVKREGETRNTVEVYLIHAVSEERAEYLHDSYVATTMQPTPESLYPINGVDAECVAEAGKNSDTNSIHIRCFKEDIVIVVYAESTPYLPASVEPDIVKFARVVADKI